MITRTMVYETTVAAGVRRLDDPRIAILNEAADAFEKYDHHLRWLADKLNDETRIAATVVCPGTLIALAFGAVRRTLEPAAGSSACCRARPERPPS